MQNDEMPKRIWLIPDAGNDGETVWCDDPAPGAGMDPNDAVEYRRADLCASGQQVRAAEIETLIEELLDAQQDINLAANERMDQSLCDASALIDRTESILRRILSSLTASHGWQPIETAPHETLVVLGWYEGDVWKQEIALASAGTRYPNGYSDRWQHGRATHWTPLPAAPEAEGGSDDR